MLTIERLLVRAALDDPTAALERAHAEASSGDESWQQWLAEYERGEALILRLHVTLEVSDSERRTIEMSNNGVFIEVDVHPPKVERQIADVISNDFSAFALKLSKLGHDLAADDLCELHVHVELGEDLRQALADPPAARARAPRADARLSRSSLPSMD
jgi:hypothetical protein